MVGFDIFIFVFYINIKMHVQMGSSLNMMHGPFQ